MKALKRILLALMSLTMLFVTVSCDEPHEHTFGKWELLEDGTKVIRTCTVCEYEEEKTAKHISNLAELLPESNKNDFNSNSTSVEKIEIDGKNVYVVDDWQDLWFGGDITIKNVIFKKGISLTTRTTEEVTVTIEDCTIFPCNQTELLSKVDKDGNYRIDNSGNGLCLNIDAPNATEANKTNRKGKITVKISNCTLIGDGSDTAVRTDSWPTTDEYNSNKNNSSYNNWKGRGNGIGLGVASGNGNFLKEVTIENCTFRNLRNDALQIYDHFTAKVTVTDCDFQGWGLNAGKPGETDNKASAIRGLVDVNSGASIEIKDCKFNSTLVTTKNMKCEVDNLLKDTDTPTKWSQSGDKWSAEATASTT